MRTKGKGKSNDSESFNTRGSETTVTKGEVIEGITTLIQRVNDLERRVEQLEIRKGHNKSSQYYTVIVGRIPGIYDNWPEANAQVDKFPGQVHKGRFRSQEHAIRWYERERSNYDKCVANNRRYYPNFDAPL